MDPKTIAAGLTVAQRQAMLMPSPNIYSSRKRALRKLGLIYCVIRDFHAWTPLGLAVRAIIQEEDHAK